MIQIKYIPAGTGYFTMVNKNVLVYRVIIGLLLLTIVGLVLKFVVLGRTGAEVDGRTTILLDPSERAVVLTEMRQFLSGIQQMLEAAERNDAAAIAKLARPLGMAAAHAVPAALEGARSGILGAALSRWALLARVRRRVHPLCSVNSSRIVGCRMPSDV